MLFLDPLQWPLKVLDEEESWKVMMWTGLLDSHGKEIYEGDVVKPIDVIRCPYVVFWETDLAMWRVKATQNIYFRWQKLADHSWEVIGNIYENPELVKP